MATIYDEMAEAMKLADSGKVAQALERLQELYSSTDDSVEQGIVLLYVGDCLAKLGKFGQAVSSFERATGLMPGSVYAKFLLACAYCDSGELERSTSMFEDLLDSPEVQIDSELLWDVKERLAFALVNARRFKKAEGILREVLGRQLSELDRQRALTYLGTTLMELEKPAEAEHVYQEALKLLPTSELAAELHYRIGTTFYKLDELEKARKHFEASIGLNFGRIQPAYVYEMLAKTCHYLGDETSAKHFEDLRVRVSRPV